MRPLNRNINHFLIWAGTKKITGVWATCFNILVRILQLKKSLRCGPIHDYCRRTCIPCYLLVFLFKSDLFKITTTCKQTLLSLFPGFISRVSFPATHSVISRVHFQGSFPATQMRVNITVLELYYSSQSEYSYISYGFWLSRTVKRACFYCTV
jgi:hypothetical protein